MTADLRCVACLVSDDPDDDWMAVTLWYGSAYCAKHVREVAAADAEARRIHAQIDGSECDT